jgi:hypothetical protein
MSSKLILAVVVSLSFPVSALAEETGFFAGVDVFGGTASGSSDTRDGGASIAGGGVVNDVKFGKTIGIGGHIGYRFDPAISAFVSYQHINGDIGWDADFPLFGVSSKFDGTAISNAILGNVAYDLPLSDSTTVGATVGVGITFNTLSDVVEKDEATGSFLADVEDHTKVSPIAQAGISVQHRITPHAVLGLNASFAYTGGFETGDTRKGNSGTTDINPYEIDDVWRASLGASAQYEF